MAIIGIEVISEFSNYNKANNENLQKSKSNKYMCYSFANGLLKSKHSISFFKPDEQCNEIDLRDKIIGGNDDKCAETVDLFLIATHGNNDGNNIILAYNTMKEFWLGNSRNWRLGNSNRRLKWLLIFGCKTINRDLVTGVSDVFQNLHQICGAYDNIEYTVYYRIEKKGQGKTEFIEIHDLDAVGEELAENLTDGRSVADSWIYASSYHNHGLFPMIVVAAERKETYLTNWQRTTMNRDHLSGEGETVSNIPAADVYWLSYVWLEKSKFTSKKGDRTLRSWRPIEN
jgi:hypothetical protein